MKGEPKEGSQRQARKETSKQKIQKGKRIVPEQTAPQKGTFSYNGLFFSFSTIAELFSDQEVAETWRKPDQRE